MTVTDERRAQLSRAGRIGGLRRWIKHPHTKDDFSAARKAFADSFTAGHGCSVCGPAVAIPPYLPIERREVMATNARKRHYRLLAERAVAKRRAQA